MVHACNPEFRRLRQEDGKLEVVLEDTGRMSPNPKPGQPSSNALLIQLSLHLLLILCPQLET